VSHSVLGKQAALGKDGRPVTDAPIDKRGSTGIRRLLVAFSSSYSGFRCALKHEALLQELILLVVLAPASLLFRVSTVEHLLLVLSMLVVVLVEFLNTAIESTVDRISLELHPLAGQAKDLGSAAVLVSIVMWALTWGVILGPQAIRLIRGA